MADYSVKTEDERGRQIRPVMFNTAKDGSGTWYFPVVDSNGYVTASSGDGTYTTPTHTAPSIGATTTAALASNANRLYALLVNDSNEVIYLKLGASAVMNEGIRLNPGGGSYETSKKAGNLYTGAINGICTSGSKVLLVTEGV